MIESTTSQPTEAATTRPLLDILADLRQARTMHATANTVITAAQQAVDVYARHEADLKDELQSAMEAQGIRTGNGSGLQAQLKTRKSNIVTDVAALTAQLQEAGMLDDFLILDKASAAKAAVQNGWDGAEIAETTYIAIKEA